MRSHSTLPLLAAALALFTACSGDDAPAGPAPAALSCRWVGVEGDGGMIVGLGEGVYCVDYGGSVVPTECPAGYAPVSACPTEGRLARCAATVTTSDGTTEETIYTYAPLTVDVARMACEAAAGTFTVL